MKTPFDAAMRIRRHEIDDAQVAISIQINQLVQIDNRRIVVDKALSKETEIAAGDHLLASHAYIERMRLQRGRLAANRTEADINLNRLRSAAMAAYGEFRAIESAADAYRDEETRRVANAEQGQLDDIAATVAMRRLRARG